LYSSKLRFRFFVLKFEITKRKRTQLDWLDVENAADYEYLEDLWRNWV